MTEKKTWEPYVSPVLVKHGSLRDLTYECPNWQCSVSVPDNPPQEP